MTLNVADVRANLNENIRHAARIIGKSKARLKVFEAIYRGKKRVKTVTALMNATSLSRVRVLQEGGRLAGNHIVEQLKVDGLIAYGKDLTYSQHKRAIIDLSKNPSRAKRYPTKQEPRPQNASTYKFKVARSLPQPVAITIDDVDSFRKVRAFGTAADLDLKRVPEARIKQFLQRIIGERGEFTDWGGEKNDLYTNKLRFRGTRRAAAFALKGKATSGPLTPKKMGKNGDQIGRLMASEADLFFVVYHSKIEQTINEQLRAHALARSMAGRRTWYGVVDGQDLGRLVAAYTDEYKA